MTTEKPPASPTSPAATSTGFVVPGHVEPDTAPPAVEQPAAPFQPISQPGPQSRYGFVPPPPKRRRTGLWIGIGVGVFATVALVCVAFLVLAVGASVFGVAATPDRYSTFVKTESVVSAATIAAGATGKPTMECHQADKHVTLERVCIWTGTATAQAAASTLQVAVLVFPSSAQKIGSGTIAAAADVGKNGAGLNDRKLISGIGQTGYAGWAEDPWTARVIFVQHNAEVIVDYGIAPAPDTSKPANWLQLAESAAKQIAVTM